MPASHIPLSHCRAGSAATSLRHPLAWVTIGVAVALVAAPSSAQDSPPSTAPAASRPATQPDSTAGVEAVPTDLANIIQRADKREKVTKEDLARALKGLHEFGRPKPGKPGRPDPAGQSLRPLRG